MTSFAYDFWVAGKNGPGTDQICNEMCFVICQYIRLLLWIRLLILICGCVACERNFDAQVCALQKSIYSNQSPLRSTSLRVVKTLNCKQTHVVHLSNLYLVSCQNHCIVNCSFSESSAHCLIKLT